MDIKQTLQRALRAHLAGRSKEAAQLCRDVLAIDPIQHDAIHLLGLAEFQLGNRDQGISYLRQALSLRPDLAETHNNLGHALQAIGNLDEAVACYRQAVQLNPNLVQGHYNLGVALTNHRQPNQRQPTQQQLHAAAACYRRALELDPSHVEAHNNLGNALQSLGQLDEAIACYRRALALQPDYLSAHINLGNVLLEQLRFDEAAAHFRRVLELQPDHAEAHNNLANTLHSQGNLNDAIAHYRQALESEPDHAETHYNLGIALKDQDRLEEAIACYCRARELKPDYFQVHNNLGAAFQAQGKFAAAGECYSRAIELSPDYAEARCAQSILFLLSGDFERGWPAYEWRWQTKKLIDSRLSGPQWDGSPLSNKTILLRAEQGFGDTFQFIRYAALVKQQNRAATIPAVTVIVQSPSQLIPLLANCPGIDRLIAEGDPLPSFDVHSPLLSLPNAFKTTLATIPANVPYLFADPALVAQWRDRLNQHPGFRIGINWEGRSTPGDHLKRNIPLSFFTTLAQQVPGIQLISLQKGPAAADLARSSAAAPILDLGPDLDTTSGPFMDTAAIMTNLDLVISSDTAVPHLAAALGIPVWLALPFVPDWRWLLDRSDSPWYPTMRLFRQKQPGDWAGVFSEIRLALQKLLEHND